MQSSERSTGDDFDLRLTRHIDAQDQLELAVAKFEAELRLDPRWDKVQFERWCVEAIMIGPRLVTSERCSVKAHRCECERKLHHMASM